MYGANYNLGLIAFIEKDYEKAEKYFEKSLYEELEASSYYQLAKIYAYKGEKDKAINFLNKAIELEPKFLKLAEKEKSFEKIRSHITVSAKMEEIDITDEYNNEKSNKKSAILIKQEKIARKYLEEKALIIEEMNESLSKEKIDKKLDSIFNKEKKQEQIKQREKEEDKDERQIN